MLQLQFPTLGFIVERYWEIQAHEPEEFWTINCSHESEEGLATFNWMYFLPTSMRIVVSRFIVLECGVDVIFIAGVVISLIMLQLRYYMRCVSWNLLPP